MKLFQKLNNNLIFWFINVFVCFILLNLFISEFSFRKDMSVNNRFELTQSTEQVLKNLKTKLYIDAFYSEDIPGEYKARLNITKELLKEIANLNKSKVALRFYNPDKDEKIRQKATSLGIAPQTLQKVERGSAQVKQAYFGVSLRLGSSNEVLPVLFFAEDLEYQILSTLKRMTRKTTSSGIGVVQIPKSSTYPQPGRMSNKDTFGAFIHQIVAEQFGSVESININEKTVPEEIISLIWVGAGELNEVGKYNLDQYLMRGGKLLFLGKSMDFQLSNNQMPGSFNLGQNQQGFATPVQDFDQIQNFTKHYGFQIEKDIISEKDNSMPMGALVQVSPGVIGRYHYPVWILSSQEKGMINRNSQYTKDIKTLLLPWSSSILTFDSSQKQAKISTLVQTTSTAGKKQDFVMLGEEQILTQNFDPVGQSVKLGVHIKGKLKSFFTKEKVPDGISPDSFLSESKKDAEIIALGTPYLISDILAFPEYRDVFQETNIPFVLNLLDMFEGDTDLIKARSKKSVVLNLKPVTKLEEGFFSFLNILFPPILIGIVSFIRIRKRVKAKN